MSHSVERQSFTVSRFSYTIQFHYSYYQWHDWYCMPSCW